jgi:zinc D-Ala-D-Ala carboxypeptidase
MGAFLAPVLAALLVLGGALPATATTTDPLPPCTYDDVLTPRARYADWDRSLLDTYFMVGSTYVPPDLTYTSNSGITGGGKVRNLAITDLAAMTRAAKAAGAPIAVTSAYRSYSTQAQLFADDVERLGYERALLHTARPGHSEHQLGIAVDFKSKRSGDRSSGGDWATSQAGSWMKNNAWKYGWIMSYPKGKTAVTCYQYEPWHYRYFGRTVAAQIHNSGMTEREWLWYQGYGQSAAASSSALPRAA